MEKRNGSEGEHGEIKAAFQSLSLVDLFEGWRLSAGMRTNTDVCDMWRGHAKICQREQTLLRIHTGRLEQKHAIFFLIYD